MAPPAVHSVSTGRLELSSAGSRLVGVVGALLPVVVLLQSVTDSLERLDNTLGELVGGLRKSKRLHQSPV